MSYIISVDNEIDEDKRLDIFISQKDQKLSRTRVQDLITNGRIAVNKNIQKSNYKVKIQDLIEIDLPELIIDSVEPENIPLEIIYEDEYLVVINKAPGMVVHPGPGNYDGTLVNALLYHCNKLSGINGVMRPGIVHRLDKDTSGLMVVAKDDVTHRKLQEKWQLREINRKYLALAHGKFTKEKIAVNAPIGRDDRDRQKMCVTDKNSRKAVTHFEVVKEYGKYTLVQAKLDTGRTHQVRVHLAFIKHPVVGDIVYGHKNDAHIIARQALHSTLLGFVHPRTDKYLEFTSPIPVDFQNAIKKITV